MSISNILEYKNFSERSVNEVEEILMQCKLVSKSIRSALKNEKIDGKALLLLNENDLNGLETKYDICLGDKKRFLLFLGIAQTPPPYMGFKSSSISYGDLQKQQSFDSYSETNLISHSTSKQYATCLQPDFFKTAVSLGYAFLVTWLTALVMVIVHERVPDSKRYPPLPDIFLDNVPRIAWAFTCCEITGSILFFIWVTLLIFHKYRLILLRRFFALGGTVFLLRCFTMLITSLSVPGTHLECAATDYKIEENDEKLSATEMLSKRFNRAYVIWSGLGMSIQGVRTCGDYMFSGHTVALTLLNFFITEYTPRTFYFLHTSTWLLNMFGIFFILAAHEHYSIDVFIAFYIASRLFLYYHTLANNQALMSNDSNRTKIWFPLFSYFESSADGIIPNEYNSLLEILKKIFDWIMFIKDLFMLNARRFWDPLQLKEDSENLNHKNHQRDHNQKVFDNASHSSTKLNKKKSNVDSINKKDDRNIK